MRYRHGLLAASLVAVLSFLALPALAAGIFTYPAGTNAEVGSGYNCFPNDINGPGAASPSLGGGGGNQTVCATLGQITGTVMGSPLNDYPNIPIGSVAYGSLGTNTTPVAGTVYVGSIVVPKDITVTAIACMNGGTAGTDKLLYSLYDGDGTLIANTATAGTTASGTDAFQELAVVTSVATPAGLYYVGWQTNGTTTRFRTVATATYINVVSGSATGTFGTLPNITVPTTFTADKAPICYVEGS